MTFCNGLSPTEAAFLSLVVSGEVHPASSCGEVNMKGTWDARPVLFHVMVSLNRNHTHDGDTLGRHNGPVE